MSLKTHQLDQINYDLLKQRLINKRYNLNSGAKSILFPSLASITISACSGSSNLIPVAAPDSTVTMEEDSTDNPLNISAPTDEDTDDILTIKVDSVPDGGVITTASGEVVSAGTTLTIEQLTGLVFTPNTDANSDLETIGQFTYTVSDQDGASDSSTVTITVTAVQDPPTIDSATATSIEENTTTIMTVDGNDVDGDTLSYSISGGADKDLFEIDAATGDLSFKAKQDFENPADADGDNIYEVEVTVDDGNGNTVSQTIQVTITDRSTSMSLSNSNIDENEAGSAIGNIDTYIDDTSSQGSFSYSVTGDGSDSFEVVNGELKLKDGVSLDFESINSYELTVTATDTSGLTHSTAFTITINDVNDAPTLVNAISDQSVDEDSALSFSMPSDTFNDVDAGDSLTYSATLSDGSDLPSWLSFDATNLTFSGTPLNENVGSLEIIVTATDGSSVSVTDTFTLTVNNTNDAPTEIVLSSLGVPEQIDGAIVGAVSTTDDDVGDTHTYSISDDRFEVVDGQLKLKAGNTVSYATEATITLSITTTDAAGETFTQEFTLLVGSIQISSTAFAENSAGVVVGDLSITDPDFTTNVTYALSGDDSDSFEVVNGQLKLKDGISADFETKSSYSVTITATDDASHEASLTYTINVTDVNETPTAVSLSATAINENNSGAIVGDLSTTDVDAGDTHAYSLSGADADSFELVNGQLKLKDSVSANYETKSTYAVTITTTDSGGLTTSEDFTVTINDINDAPTLVTALTDQSNAEDAAFSFTIPSGTFNDEDGDTITYTATLSDGSALPTWLSLDGSTGVFSGTPLNDDVGVINVTVTASDGTLSVTDTFALTVVNTNDDPTAVTLSATAIDENSSGVVVGDLSTTDVDVGDTHTYELSGTDADSFEIVNGQLKLKDSVSANYETKSTYAVTVTTTDGSGSTFAESFSITINDINEAPTAISLSAAAIDENATGAVVGTLTTTDEDGGDSVTYTLSGADAASFEVVNGELKLKSDVSADHETQTSYSVTVTATDSGELTTSEDFTVTVNNLNDNSPTITSNSSVEMAENSNEVITVVGNDADGDTLVYSISGGNDAGLFTIDSATGALTLQAKTNGLTTTATSLPFSLTNLVDNGDGTYTVDIEVDLTVYSYAAVGGITLALVFDSTKISFDKTNLDITAGLTALSNNTSSGVKIVLYDGSGVNSFTGGKLGTLTFTPVAGATDPSITLTGSLTGGALDSIDSTESAETSTIYNWEEVRTDVDYENPTDANADNVYEVTIQVSDGENTVTQDISVTVTDVSESGRIHNESTDNNDPSPTEPDNGGGDSDILPTWDLGDLPFFDYLDPWLTLDINLPVYTPINLVSLDSSLDEISDFTLEASDSWILDLETFEANQEKVVFSEHDSNYKNTSDILSDDYSNQIIDEPLFYSYD